MVLEAGKGGPKMRDDLGGLLPLVLGGATVARRINDSLYRVSAAYDGHFTVMRENGAACMMRVERLMADLPPSGWVVEEKARHVRTFSDLREWRQERLTRLTSELNEGALEDGCTTTEGRLTKDECIRLIGRTLLHFDAPIPEVGR
jgi:hypothetical protein